jgi:hypothetical protein
VKSSQQIENASVLRKEMPTEMEPTSGWPSEKAFFFAFWLFTVAKVSSMMVVDDPDLWGHVFYGLQHFSVGSLLRFDTYSYTASGAQWINHEWLCEFLFAMSWKAAGSTGLWAIRLLLVGVTLGIVLRLIRKTTRGVWAGLVIYIVCWLEIARGFAIRPQLFTYLLFAVLLFLLHGIYLQRSWSPWWTLAFGPLMALWANLHGGFVVGLGLLSWVVFCALVEWLRGRMTRQRFLLILFGVALSYPATLLNPYGVDLWEWLVRSLSVSRASHILEWQPVHLFQAQSSVIGFYATVALMVLFLVATRRKRDLFEWGLLLTMCLVAWINNRHGVLFCTAAAVFLPRHVESVLPRLAAPRGFHRLFVLAVVVLGGAYATGIHFLPRHRPTAILVETSKHPYNAMKFIHDNGLRGNLVVWFNWAQSTIWYLHDTCKVAFDGRFRTVYPRVVEDDYFYFNDLDDQWANLIDRYDTQMVLMPGNWPGIKLLERRGDWQLVYRSIVVETPPQHNRQGEDAVLLIRRGVFSDFETRLKRSDFVSPEARTVFRFGEPLKGELG